MSGSDTETFKIVEVEGDFQRNLRVAELEIVWLNAMTTIARE